MPLQDSEILWRPAALISDATPAQNGGRMRFAALPSGVKNNLFPDVTKAERDAGSVRWRKAFVHVASADNTPLINARIFIDAPTAAQDFVTLHLGTDSDTQASVSTRPYGVAVLPAPAAAGGNELAANCESAACAALQPFRAGDIVRIGKAGGDPAGEQFTTVSAVSYSGAAVTLTLADALAYAFAAGDVVSSVIESASVAAEAGGATVSSAAGTFDVAHLAPAAAGGASDTWTLTFTSASAFTVTGLATGAVGNGSIYGDLAPINPATGTPFFTVKMAAWGGTWQAGNTVSFWTKAAAVPLWYRREVPAGAVSAASNATSVSVIGESA